MTEEEKNIYEIAKLVIKIQSITPRVYEIRDKFLTSCEKQSTQIDKIKRSLTLTADKTDSSFRKCQEQILKIPTSEMTFPKTKIGAIDKTQGFKIEIPSFDIQDRVFEALKISIPYLPEEEQEFLEEVVANEIGLQPKKKLTLDQLIALVSLLFSILTYIHCHLPDNQLDELIELEKEHIVSETQDQKSPYKNSADLQNTINTLSETICILSDEIDSLSEQVQDMNDLENSDIQSNNTQTLNNDNDP